VKTVMGMAMLDRVPDISRRQSSRQLGSNASST